jgi:HEPN domain-containing protein
MSQNKFRSEAERWLETASEDLRAARLLRDSQLFAHACFMSQQCGEKAVKAMWYAVAQEPSGQSIQKLVMQFPEPQTIPDIDTWRHHAAVLDKFYSSTRYPNELPDLTPGQSYFAQDADQAIEYATILLRVAHQTVGHPVNLSTHPMLQPPGSTIVAPTIHPKIDFASEEFKAQSLAMLPPKMDPSLSSDDHLPRRRRQRSWKSRLKVFVSQTETWIFVIVLILAAIILGIVLPLVLLNPSGGKPIVFEMVPIVDIWLAG